MLGGGFFVRVKPRFLVISQQFVIFLKHAHFHQLRACVCSQAHPSNIATINIRFLETYTFPSNMLGTHVYVLYDTIFCLKQIWLYAYSQFTTLYL